MRRLAPFFATLACLGLQLTAEAADVAGLAQAIDGQIEEKLVEANVVATEPTADHQFIRRITLDLAGRVPTSAEVEAFLRSSQADKREQLTRQLIDSPDFAFHHRNEIDTLLLRRLQHNDSWREYLLEATHENRSWDRLFREIMLPDDARPAAFLRQRINDLDVMTNDSSILWFGVNVGCAKCHDHPLVFDWTQAHYYGMASFFKRTFRTKKGMIGERFDGRLKYTTTSGDEHDADFMFLTGAKVQEPESDLEEATLKTYRESIKQAENDENADPPPMPEFRPRAELVELALTETEQRFFAKNIVNRTWARLMGRGFVHPLDQMHSENPPSDPELLRVLTDDFAEHGYDLKRLIHAIVLSRTYQRQTSSVSSSQQTAQELFAAAIPRPLSPHQLSLSMLIATSSPEQMAGLTQPQTWPQQRESLERKSEGYARNFDIPDPGFQVSVGEALWQSNNAAVHDELLAAGLQKLVGYLSRFDSDAEVAIRATRAILARPPVGEELSNLIEYLEERSDRRQDAIGQVVWALMNSPEFRFNH